MLSDCSYIGDIPDKSSISDILKVSFAVEVIFDYLTHINNEYFNQYIFEKRGDELVIDLRSVSKVCRFLSKIWKQRNSGRFASTLIPGKMKRVYPVVLNFVRSKEKVIEKIAADQADLYRL